MRKNLLITMIALLIGWQAVSWAQPSTGIGNQYTTYKQRATAAPTPPSTYNRLYFKSDGKMYYVNSSGTEAVAGGVQTSTECNAAAYFADGTLCQDTDDNKLYLGTGAAVVLIGSAEISALGGLTFADKSIIQLTGASAAAVLTCSAANQIIGVNAANDALECKDSLSVTSVKLTGDLTGLAPSVIVLVPSGTSADVASETVLTHADDSSATNAYVGMQLYNITDTHNCTVTASTNTTITCAAGAGMAWSNTNVYQLGPGPTQSGSVFYVAGAGTIRHPATAGYTAGYVADGTNKLIIDMASDSMELTATIDTTVTAIGAGDCIESSDTTIDDYIVIHNKSATSAKGLGSRGTWADGGAS